MQWREYYISIELVEFDNLNMVWEEFREKGGGKKFYLKVQLEIHDDVAETTAEHRYSKMFVVDVINIWKPDCDHLSLEFETTKRMTLPPGMVHGRYDVSFWSTDEHSIHDDGLPYEMFKDGDHTDVPANKRGEVWKQTYDYEVLDDDD